MVNLNKIYEYCLDKQLKLDDIILTDVGKTREETVYDRVLAMIKEVEELENALGSFKYWKRNKKNAESPEVKEEYADVIHFMVSCLHDAFQKVPEEEQKKTLKRNSTVIDIEGYGLDEIFSDFFKYASEFREVKRLQKTTGSVMLLNSGVFHCMVCCVVEIGYHLGYTTRTIKSEYDKKYKINLERVANKY